MHPVPPPVARNGAIRGRHIPASAGAAAAPRQSPCSSHFQEAALGTRLTRCTPRLTRVQLQMLARQKLELEDLQQKVQVLEHARDRTGNQAAAAAAQGLEPLSSLLVQGSSPVRRRAPQTTGRGRLAPLQEGTSPRTDAPPAWQARPCGAGNASNAADSNTDEDGGLSPRPPQSQRAPVSAKPEAVVQPPPPPKQIPEPDWLDPAYAVELVRRASQASGNGIAHPALDDGKTSVGASKGLPVVVAATDSSGSIRRWTARLHIQSDERLLRLAALNPSGHSTSVVEEIDLRSLEGLCVHNDDRRKHQADAPLELHLLGGTVLSLSLGSEAARNTALEQLRQACPGVAVQVLHAPEAGAGGRAGDSSASQQLRTMDGASHRSPPQRGEPPEEEDLSLLEQRWLEQDALEAVLLYSNNLLEEDGQLRSIAAEALENALRNQGDRSKALSQADGRMARRALEDALLYSEDSFANEDGQLRSVAAEALERALNAHDELQGMAEAVDIATPSRPSGSSRSSRQASIRHRRLVEPPQGPQSPQDEESLDVPAAIADLGFAAPTEESEAGSEVADLADTSVPAESFQHLASREQSPKDGDAASAAALVARLEDPLLRGIQSDVDAEVEERPMEVRGPAGSSDASPAGRVRRPSQLPKEALQKGLAEDLETSRAHREVLDIAKEALSAFHMQNEEGPRLEWQGALESSLSDDVGLEKATQELKALAQKALEDALSQVVADSALQQLKQGAEAALDAAVLRNVALQEKAVEARYEAAHAMRRLDEDTFGVEEARCTAAMGIERILLSNVGLEENADALRRTAGSGLEIALDMLAVQ